MNKLEGWQRNLDTLDRSLGAAATSVTQTYASPGIIKGCGLVAIRHIAKTGGVSVRDWMLRLERQGRAQYLGPVTWMKYRGRFCSHGRYLYCCHPLDARPATQCRKVTLTEARSAALKLMAREIVDKDCGCRKPRERHEER